MLGGDFAFTHGEWGFRGEIAYTKLNKDRLLPDAAPQSTVYGVLGVEREVAENNLLLVQWLHRRLLDDAPTDSASPFTQPVAQVNAGNLRPVQSRRQRHEREPQFPLAERDPADRIGGCRLVQ